MLNWFRRKAEPVVSDRWLIGKTKDAGLDVLIRMRDKTPAEVIRDRYPRSLTISWRYDGSENSGMPPRPVHERMSDLEERLDTLEGPALGFLLVSITGNHQKEWTWQVVGDAAYMLKMNEVLAGLEPFPIEVVGRDDPQWETFDLLRGQLSS